MFSWSKRRAEFKQFQRLFEYAEHCPIGSDEALRTCNTLLQLLDQSDKWPEYLQSHTGFYRGYTLYIYATSALLQAQNEEETQQAFSLFEDGLSLLRKNNFQDGWVSCAMDLAGTYAFHPSVW